MKSESDKQTGIWRHLSRDMKLAEGLVKNLKRRASRFLALSSTARRRAIRREWRKRFPNTPRTLSGRSRLLYRQVIDSIMEFLEHPDGSSLRAGRGGEDVDPQAPSRT